MGGDYAPESVIKGVCLAKKELAGEDTIVLFGKQSVIEDLLSKEQCDKNQLQIVDCGEVVDMHDSPIKAFREKSSSSLAVGFAYLKKGLIDTFASAGNSGAMLVGTMYSVGLMENVLRPCLAALIPKAKQGVTVLLDVGVDTDTKPEVLCQFGLLGSYYAENSLGIKNPRVSLLNIGEEEGKGNLQSKAAYQLMKESKYNFVGNAEPSEIFKDNTDVIVCDGFVGNLLMKNIESFAKTIAKRGLVDEFIGRFNYEIYGGLPLLGANGVVIIGHGVSNDKAIKSMIFQSKKIYESGMVESLRNVLQTNK